MAGVHSSENELQTRNRVVSNAMKERDNCIVLKVDTHLDAVDDLSPFGFHFELDKRTYELHKKRQRWIKLTKWFSWIAYYHHKFGIRHITLVTFLTVYVFIGGAVFTALESDNEISLMRSTILKLNEAINCQIQNINDLTGNFNLSLNDSKIFNEKLYIIIRSHYKEMMSIEGKYQGSAFYKSENETSNLVWHLSSATFYSMTLFSTIGYGTIACSTTAGRAASIVYTIIGLPLMILVLGDIGQCLQKYLTNFYIWILFKIKKWRGHEIPCDTSKILLPMWIALLLITTHMLLCSLIIQEFDYVNGENPGIHFFEAFYFTFISLTTIGLGDVMPNNIHYSPVLAAVFLFGLSLVSIINSSIYTQLYGGFYRIVQAIEQFLERVHKHNIMDGKGYHVFRNEVETTRRRAISDTPVIASKQLPTDSASSSIRYRSPTIGAFGGFDMDLFTSSSDDASHAGGIRVNVPRELEQSVEIFENEDAEINAFTDTKYFGVHNAHAIRTPSIA